MKISWVVAVIVFAFTYVAVTHFLTTGEDAGSGVALLEDQAQLFDAAESLDLTHYHQILLDDYDIDYRVITTRGAQDLNIYAAKQFETLRVGNHSSSGRGLLLVINPNSNQLRMEVGRNLEGVYTDAFVAYIERYQMVPFFRKNRLVDGILATTEMIISRAQDANRSSAFDLSGEAEPSTGAGAIAQAGIGIEAAPQVHDQPDVSATGKPADTVNAYIHAMQQGNSRPDLDIYSKASRQMLKEWVVTKAQMRNVVRDHRTCTGERSFIEAQKAVVVYDAQSGVCNPYLLRKEGGQWRIDFAYMQKIIRFDTNNHWHMPWGAKDFAFGFTGIEGEASAEGR